MRLSPCLDVCLEPHAPADSAPMGLREVLPQRVVVSAPHGHLQHPRDLGDAHEVLRRHGVYYYCGRTVRPSFDLICFSLHDSAILPRPAPFIQLKGASLMRTATASAPARENMLVLVYRFRVLEPCPGDEAKRGGDDA